MLYIDYSERSEKIHTITLVKTLDITRIVLLFSWYEIDTTFWPRITSDNSPYSQLRRTPKSELLKTFFPIHATGRIISTMVFPESSRPEAMVGWEKELVGFDELYNERIHNACYF